MVTGSGSELNLVARAWSQRLQVSLGPTCAKQHRAERAGPDIHSSGVLGLWFDFSSLISRMLGHIRCRREK